jgi:hypothetical protein
VRPAFSLTELECGPKIAGMRIALGAALLAGVLAASAAADPASGLTTLRVTVRPGFTYREGAFYYVALAHAGRTVAKRHRQDAGVLTLRVKPGRYRLAAWAQPCEAACPRLDPPTSKCGRQVALRARTYRAVVAFPLAPSSSCRISFC